MTFRDVLWRGVDKAWYRSMGAAPALMRRFLRVSLWYDKRYREVF